MQCNMRCLLQLSLPIDSQMLEGISRMLLARMPILSVPLDTAAF